MHNTPPESDVLGRAVAFATLHHADQRRKDANQTPYVAHLLAVASLAFEDGGSQDHAIAGLLHDTLEDCPAVTPELLSAEFGPAVTAMVVGCTDYTPGAMRGEWRERKQAYLDHLYEADEDVLLVSNADKLHNLSCLLADFTVETDPEQALSRFSNPDGIVWYYTELGHAFAARRPGRRNQIRFQTAVDTLRQLLA